MPCRDRVAEPCVRVGLLADELDDACRHLVLRREDDLHALLVVDAPGGVLRVIVPAVSDGEGDASLALDLVRGQHKARPRFAVGLLYDADAGRNDAFRSIYAVRFKDKAVLERPGGCGDGLVRRAAGEGGLAV